MTVMSSVIAAGPFELWHVAKMTYVPGVEPTGIEAGTSANPPDESEVMAGLVGPTSTGVEPSWVSTVHNLMGDPGVQGPASSPTVVLWPDAKLSLLTDRVGVPPNPPAPPGPEAVRGLMEAPLDTIPSPKAGAAAKKRTTRPIPSANNQFAGPGEPACTREAIKSCPDPRN